MSWSQIADTTAEAAQRELPLGVRLRKSAGKTVAKASGKDVVKKVSSPIQELPNDEPPAIALQAKVNSKYVSTLPVSKYADLILEILDSRAKWIARLVRYEFRRLTMHYDGPSHHLPDPRVLLCIEVYSRCRCELSVFNWIERADCDVKHVSQNFDCLLRECGTPSA